MFQVANYGIGGVYNAHPDPMMYSDRAGSGDLDEDKKVDFITRGDRLATFMGYLSDVQLGGATVFPNIGVSISPERGSAAFWWAGSISGMIILYPVCQVEPPH